MAIVNKIWVGGGINTLIETITITSEEKVRLGISCVL